MLVTDSMSPVTRMDAKSASVAPRVRRQAAGGARRGASAAREHGDVAHQTLGENAGIQRMPLGRERRRVLAEQAFRLRRALKLVGRVAKRDPPAGTELGERLAGPPAAVHGAARDPCPLANSRSAR